MKKTSKKKETESNNETDDEMNVGEIGVSVVAITRSGLYKRRPQTLGGVPITIREDLRVDIDGLYPQMQISGTIYGGLTQQVHWIAKVVKTPGIAEWTGNIWYKDGTGSLMPYTSIVARISAGASAISPSRITFNATGQPSITQTYDFVSPYFHPLEIEFDSATGVTPVTQINTCDHPNRPGSIACETLTIQKVYERAGFDVKTSSGTSVVPLTGASTGVDSNWSDNEMHDAMQTFWSRFANTAQWSMWVFFAGLHEVTPDIPDARRLGGIMFDSIGANHRQGTAIFNNSFISQAPPGDPNPAAWVRRMKFWTACHEMGHSFNLAHSWQKRNSDSWIPLTNEPEGRTFMNYPFNVNGGDTSFFSDFTYRFSDSELLFMRHAPERFVEMGNALWFDNHGFQQANVSAEPTFRLEVRANREKPIFEFLEPVMLETKLTNISDEPQIIEETLLNVADRMTVIIKKQGQDARQWFPYAQYCFKPNKIVLNANESIYDSLFVAVGKNGWDVAEPGNYTIQVALNLENEDIVSQPFNIRVAPPRGYDEEFLAQDFFSEDVGRILTFDGSRTLESGNNTLREVNERFPDKAVAVHAKIALGEPLTRDYKLLSLPDGVRDMTSAAEDNGKIKVIKAEAAKADKQLSAALFENTSESAETLGHIDYQYYVDQFSEFAADEGNKKKAAEAQNKMQEMFSKRGVLPRVIKEIDERKNSYDSSSTKGKKK